MRGRPLEGDREGILFVSILKDERVGRARGYLI